MAENFTGRPKAQSPRTASARWRLWKENFERTYGKGTVVSKAWLEKEWAKTAKRTAKGRPDKHSTKASEEAGVSGGRPGELLNSALQAGGAGLAAIRADLGECRRCKLCDKRTTIVFGEGNPEAKLMFVGEGPGEQEDLQARPFVGRAGQLLDKIIEAMGLKRGDVYIANVVKCRPPGNRVPQPDEVAACETFLFRQIDSIRPKLVVALGATALKCLFHSEDIKITKLRGTFMDYRGTKLMPTYHPAFLLRNPPAKKDVWDDMKKVMEELGLNKNLQKNLKTNDKTI